LAIHQSEFIADFNKSDFFLNLITYFVPKNAILLIDNFFTGQEEDPCAQHEQEVEGSGHLGKGDETSRMQWWSQSQVQTQSSR